MRSMIRRLFRQEEGASATEFALVVFPMTCLLLIGLQFGLLLFVHNDMLNAARDAARRWAANSTAILTSAGTTTCGLQTANSVEDAVCQQLTAWGNMTFQVTPTVQELGGSGACEELTVDVTTPMADATPFNIFGILDGRTLSASAIFVSQYDILEGGNSVPGVHDCVGY